LRVVQLLVPDGRELDDPLSPYLRVDRVAPVGGCWVLANMVTGLDGAAAIAGRVGSLSSPKDAELFGRMRGLADVVLVGAETVRRERYGPVRLDDDLVAWRTEQGRTNPIIAVVSASLDLDRDLPLFAAADPDRPPIIVTCASSDQTRLAGRGVDTIVVGDDRVDLAAALGELARRSLPIVLCEGGPALLGGLIGAGLLDEYCLSVAPIVGGDALPVVDTRGMEDLSRFALAHVAEEDDTLFLRYVRTRP
jgi:riboflavin biosynthesis pyrimidine reductase